MTNVGLELISSRENNSIKTLVKLISSKKERREQGLFVVEGVRLTTDALKSGVKILELYFTDDAFYKYENEINLLKSSSQKTSRITDAVSEKISDTMTPQGIYALCEINMRDSSQKLDKSSRIMLLSSIQDPGNMGTIIRSCEAFGISKLVVSSDCPDIYSSKVLRGSMGGVFRLPIEITDNIDEYIEDIKADGVKVYATALSENAIPINDIEKTGALAVVIGNEGNGLSEETINLCDNAVIIPMKGTAESLNASIAASIIAFEITK